MNKEINENIIKNIKNLYILEKENKTIKDRIIRDIRNLFEYEEDCYYKSVRVGNSWSNNYVEYKSKDYRKTNNILIKLGHI